MKEQTFFFNKDFTFKHKKARNFKITRLYFYTNKLQEVYFIIASIPGKVLPSKLSNIAPPPVET